MKIEINYEIIKNIVNYIFDKHQLNPAEGLSSHRERRHGRKRDEIKLIVHQNNSNNCFDEQLTFPTEHFESNNKDII